MKTYTIKPQEIKREWYIVDATGLPLGRLASAIASVLRGKHKPAFSPHLDVGDHVIVINAEQVGVTGRKKTQKLYHRHSGYIGGLRNLNLEEMLADKPEKVIELAVKGMLPKNKLGRAMLKKLKVYAGPEHPHEAQKPKPLELEVRGV